MTPTRVVHCKRDSFDIYIGRPSSGGYEHYGNPFTHKVATKASVILSSRQASIEAFRLWLAGEAYPEVNPEQRKWILANLSNLQGKRLGCWCVPSACHGHVLAQLADLTVQPATLQSKIAPIEQLDLL